MDLLLACSSVTPRAIKSAIYSVSAPESSLKLDLLFWLFLCAYCTLLGAWVHKQTCACLLVAWASCLCCLRQVVSSEASSVHMSVLACVCTCACVYMYMRLHVCVEAREHLECCRTIILYVFFPLSSQPASVAEGASFSKDTPLLLLLGPCWLL